jgi:hypothetical protein
LVAVLGRETVLFAANPELELAQLVLAYITNIMLATYLASLQE